MASEYQASVKYRHFSNDLSISVPFKHPMKSEYGLELDPEANFAAVSPLGLCPKTTEWLGSPKNP